VAWQRIAPHLLKQEAPGARRVWYRDDGPLVEGGLLLWLDDAGRLTRFELTHTPFPGTREYVADWQASGALRLGQVGDGEGGPPHKMAPIVRYEQPDAGRLAALAAYFAGNAAVVEPRHRAAVAGILGAPAALAADPPLPYVRATAHAVSGKNGGHGPGTAATRKRV
jgi:hypothetical protein